MPMHELTITGAGSLSRYPYFWLKFVRGFDPTQHCAKCLIGQWGTGVSNRLRVGSKVALTPKGPFDFIYLCGVEQNWAGNIHLAAVPAPGKTAEVRSVDGKILFQISNAERIPIQPLPSGWEGRTKAFTACRNFQFGVQQYYPHSARDIPSSAAVTSHDANHTSNDDRGQELLSFAKFKSGLNGAEIEKIGEE